MKRLFILCVLLHLVVDLAMPSLPGAFRFNADESVLGIRVQTHHAQQLTVALQVNWLRASVDSPRFEGRVPANVVGRPRGPDVPMLLPRRNPSSTQSPPAASEDPLTFSPGR